MATVRRLLLIVNLRSLVVTAMAVASTWVCGHWSLQTDLPLSLMATAVVFPIVFSIGAAYKRREAALDEYGSVKAHCRALFFAPRDWLDQQDPGLLEESRKRVGAFFAALRAVLMASEKQMAAEEQRAYTAFSDWSRFIRSLREHGLPSGEVSRCNQYLSKIMYSFERLKHFHQYRTPVTLRAFSALFVVLLPVLCGPYFVHLTDGKAGTWAYIMAVVTSLVLVSLENIQSHLEDPFDQVGEDDVVIRGEKFVETLEA